MAYAVGTIAPRRPVVAPLRASGAVGAPTRPGAPVLLAPQLAVGAPSMVASGSANAGATPAGPPPVAAMAPAAAPDAGNPVAQTMAPIAYAMDKYQEPGDPFTAAAMGFVYGKQAQQAQAEDDSKKAEAAKMLGGHPDLQSAVKRGVLSLDTAVQMKTNRDNVTANTKITAERRASIDHYLRAAGDDDIADQFASGLLDEEGVSKAVSAKDGATADPFTLKNPDGSETRYSGAGDVVASSAGPGGGQALPTVTLDANGVPDRDAQKQFLDGLSSDEERTMVQGVANYQIDPNSNSIRNGQRAHIISLAKMLDPTYVTSQYAAAAKVRQSLTSGPYSQTLQSANLVIQHLATLKGAFDALGNQSGLLTPLNIPANALKGATGDPNIKSLMTARDGVATELSKVFRGAGAMSEKEIEEWKANFDANTSPEGMQASITTAMEMLNARLDTVKAAYNNALGKPQDFKFLTGQTIDALGQLGIDPTALDPLMQDGNAQDLAKGFHDLPKGEAPPAKPAATPSAAPAKEIDPGDKAGYDALPVGASYTVPGDPTVYTKRQQ